jgi:hypothetical protein
MPTRNKTEGNRWERLIAQVLRNCGIYPHVSTTRSCNRSRDDQGIDLCNRDESVHGRMQDDIQAKTTTTTPNIELLLQSMKSLDTMDERTPVVLWRKTGKSAGGKFMEKGQYAACFMEDYIRLLKTREASKVLLPHKHTLIAAVRKDNPGLAVELETKLKILDLFHD